MIFKKFTYCKSKEGGVVGPFELPYKGTGDVIGFLEFAPAGLTTDSLGELALIAHARSEEWRLR